MGISLPLDGSHAPPPHHDRAHDLAPWEGSKIWRLVLDEYRCPRCGQALDARTLNTARSTAFCLLGHPAHLAREFAAVQARVDAGWKRYHAGRR